MLKSKIEILNLEKALELKEKFKNVDCHQAQDLIKGVFVKQKCITIEDESGEVLAYSFIEFNGLKRVTIWYGPIILDLSKFTSVIQELKRKIESIGIWQITFYLQSTFYYKSLKEICFQKNFIINKEILAHPIAIKNIDQMSELDLKKSYKTRLRKSLLLAEEANIEVRKISEESELNHLIDLVIKMYNQKKISIVEDKVRSQLLSDFKFVLKTGQGSLIAAYDNGKCFGCALQIYSGYTAYYVYSASDKDCRIPIMHPALHFGILESIKAGMKFFDFGVYYPNSDDSQLKGLTVFKNSFGVDCRNAEPTVVIAANNIKSQILNVFEILIKFKNLLNRKKSISI